MEFGSSTQPGFYDYRRLSALNAIPSSKQTARRLFKSWVNALFVGEVDISPIRSDRFPDKFLSSFDPLSPRNFLISLRIFDAREIEKNKSFFANFMLLIYLMQDLRYSISNCINI